MHDLYFLSTLLTNMFSHTAHAALTLWSLGADETILERSYEESKKEQRAAYTSPHPITKKNWTEHVGDEK